MNNIENEGDNDDDNNYNGDLKFGAHNIKTLRLQANGRLLNVKDFEEEEEEAILDLEEIN